MVINRLFVRFRRQPFWIVTLASTIPPIVATLILLLLYWQTPDWQYAALAGIAGGITLIHGAAWFIAWKWSHVDFATWLIATTQVLSAVAAPLFMTDYWLIGPFLLAAVPIQIGISDQLRRMPMFVVFTLFGAAGMLAVDLLALSDRIAIFGQPIVKVLVIALSMLSIITLCFLLWLFRLRPRASHRVHYDLATQQSLFFAAIAAASIVVVTGVLVNQIRQSQIEQVGENFQILAEINAERVGNTLEEQVDELLSLGRREIVLQEGLEAANAAYPESREETQKLLAERERLWQTSPETSEFVLQYRSNPQTIELSRFRGADLLYNNVLLTDVKGGLVAAQGEKPERYYFGDETWWQIAWNKGQGDIYLGNLQIDPDTKVTTIFIAVAIISPQTNRTVGILASQYDLRAVQHEIKVATSRGTGQVTLLTSDGRVVAGQNESLIGEKAWSDLFSSEIILPEDGRLSTKSDWLLGQDREDHPAVLAYAPLKTTSGVRLDPIRTLGLHILVSDTQQNALAQVTRSSKIAGLVGLLVTAMVVLAAIAIARVLTRPIEALTTTAAAMSAGSLDQRARPVGPIELVTLAESFNTLTGQLRSLISSLQDQVEQRTAQLEARVEQLATLNRITQTVASFHDLETALGAVAQEMVQLFHGHDCGIALLDEEHTALTVVADYFGGEGLTSMIGVKIPLADNSSSQEAILSGRSMVVSNAQTNPIATLIHGVMRRQQVECLMMVPLLARGEVIGTIGIGTDQPGREFTPAEVSLAETVAGQIAVAIERARLYTEAQDARAAAEEANESKSAFLASVSHELRTPLTSVLGFAKIIQKRLDERIFPLIKERDARTERTITQIAENVQIIVEEGDRLTALINNVLDLSKIEAGKVEWDMQPLSIAAVAERAVAATKALFVHKNLNLIYDVPDTLPLITGDRDRLIQVVVNLISNAVKFTPEGSVTCRARQVYGEIVLSIMDTGIGIASEDQQTVFEKFKQVGDTLTDKPQGTGLGLPICKEIVEYHGGRIWVESTPGQGSNFSFAIPILATHTVRITEGDFTVLVETLKEQMLKSSMRQKNILIVDDDTAIREMLQQELRSAGYLVESAKTGQEAITGVKLHQPDLMILDILLPDMSGFEIITLIRSIPQFMNLPIIVLSIVEDKDKGLRMGADSYLLKPIDSDALLQEIEKVFERGYPKRKILIADENVELVRILSDMLSQQGHDVVCIQTEELIEQIETISPHMVMSSTHLTEHHDIMEKLRARKDSLSVFLYQ